jgi:hypothetical protein
MFKDLYSQKQSPVILKGVIPLTGKLIYVKVPTDVLMSYFIIASKNICLHITCKNLKNESEKQNVHISEDYIFENAYH